MGEVGNSRLHLEVADENDMLYLRRKLRGRAEDMAFSSLQTTKLLTAASEIVRNMMVHAGGGSVDITTRSSDDRTGIRVVFRDEGPGIEDVNHALTMGVRSDESNGLGQGLSGAKRLADDFRIESELHHGTTVDMTFWT